MISSLYFVEDYLYTPWHHAFLWRWSVINFSPWITISKWAFTFSTSTKNIYIMILSNHATYDSPQSWLPTKKTTCIASGTVDDTSAVINITTKATFYTSCSFIILVKKLVFFIANIYICYYFPSQPVHR